MDKQIAECIEAIFNSIALKSEEDSFNTIKNAIQHIKKNNIDISNPEYFDCFINSKLNNATKVLVNSINDNITFKYKNKANFIYTDYSFLKNNIRNLCEFREGMTCSCDKARYIIKMYLNYSLTGKIPKFNPNLEKYFIPNFGDNEMWIRYCDSLYSLKYGRSNEYFIVYNELIQSEIRRFKHILHKWYIELNNKEIIEVGHTWDNNNENLLDILDKGTFYIINKTKVKSSNFNEYIPVNKDDIYFRGYLKIPKSEIKKIYKISEEQMI